MPPLFFLTYILFTFYMPTYGASWITLWTKWITFRIFNEGHVK